MQRFTAMPVARTAWGVRGGAGWSLLGAMLPALLLSGFVARDLDGLFEIIVRLAVPLAAAAALLALFLWWPGVAREWRGTFVFAVAGDEFLVARGTFWLPRARGLLWSCPLADVTLVKGSPIGFTRFRVQHDGVPVEFDVYTWNTAWAAPATSAVEHRQSA